MALKKSQLYSSLWQSCDELRGGMDASQYKDYVLTLLFMKYVSDRYAGRPDAIIVVPEGGGFADMVKRKGDKEIGDRINKIIGNLAEANDLKGVIDQADFNDSAKLGAGKEMQDRLSKLVAIFEGLDLSANRAEGGDLLGDAYEYPMRHFATESGKSKGQFYTPAEVSRIMAKVIGVGPDTRPDQTLYDPTCGSGSLLLKAADEAPNGITVYGQEMDNATWALARMNMFLHGQGRERLEEARDAVKALCEPVEPPRDSAAYRRYFCAGDSGNAGQLEENKPKRVALYKHVAAFLRAYANLANEMGEAGYSESEVRDVKAEVGHYEKVREEVKLASGDYIDLKLYEPAMRHLLDTYIRADDSESLSEFDDLTLVELVVERGRDGLESALPNRIRKDPEAMAETIENNVRRIVIDEMAVNPKCYARMSKLLDALILERRQESLDYKEYLDRIIALAKRIKRPESESSYPPGINTAALRALFDNLDSGPDSMVREPPPPPYGGELAHTDAREEMSLALDRAIRRVKRADWRGNVFKEREVRNVVRSVLAGDEERVDAMFEIVKSQPDY